MPERLADAIEELSKPNRSDAEPEEQSPPDAPRRRRRLVRYTPAPVLAVLVAAAAVAAGWAVYWALGLPAVSSRAHDAGLPFGALRLACAVVAALLVGAAVARICHPAQTLRRELRSSLTASRRRATRIPLFGAVVLAAVLGAGVAAVLTWKLTGEVFPAGATDTSSSTLRAALPLLIGAAVAVLVVLVFRRQLDAERGRFAERFGAASAQLGDAEAATRIAGVFALAAAADESSTFARRQQCIDVLCGYLRLPYDPEFGANHLAELVSTTTWTATAPATNIEESRRQAIRQNDGAVRQTVVRVIAGRLQRDADASWAGNDFDFTGVLFEDASFAGAVFRGRRVRFDGATFSGDATSFEGAAFDADRVSFDGARFVTPVTTFASARLRAGQVSFDRAVFDGADVSFEDIRFNGEDVSFREVAFAGDSTSFARAKFKCLHAAFDAPVTWRAVTFDWEKPETPGGSPQTIPRCIGPRPWPPTLSEDQLVEKKGVRKSIEAALG
ncbi:hypothetical protein AB0K11_17715 [Mycobacterium sp. NPDC050551]|uniref:hypothetical protein n=1 Tax=Mycobacterium sp. NPDC050551 TaxID=3155407 RepID=UPI0034197ABE